MKTTAPDTRKLDVNPFIYEYLLLCRLLYKAKNQHHRTKYYKKLQYVKRICNQFQSIQLDNLKSLTDAYKLLQLGIQAMKDAFVICKREVAQSYFMALNMMFMGVLSSLYSETLKVLDWIQMEYVAVYDTLEDKSRWPSRIGEAILASNGVKDDVVESVPVDLDDKMEVEIQNVKKYQSSLQLQQQTSLSDCLFESPTVEEKLTVVEDKNVPSEPVPDTMSKVTKKKVKKKKRKDTDEIDDLFAQFL